MCDWWNLSFWGISAKDGYTLELYDSLLTAIISQVQYYHKAKIIQITVSSFTLENGQIQGFL